MTDYRSLVDAEVGRAVDVHLADRSYSLNPYKEAYLYHRPANPGEAISPLVISDVSPDGYELSDGRRLFGNRNQMFNLIREIAYRLPILDNADGWPVWARKAQSPSKAGEIKRKNGLRPKGA